MSYTKTLADADKYFLPNNHLKAETWKGYSSDERKAALTQAQRQLELYSNRAMNDPSVDARYRDDYAVFEQAVFLLDELPRKEGSGTPTLDTATKKGGKSESNRPEVGISREAQRFLGMNRIMVVRG